MADDRSMVMTSRERVLTALAHEEPDRVPIVIGVSNTTGIKMTPYRELKRTLGIEAPDAWLYDWPELGTAAVDETTLRRLHGDVRAVLDLEPASVLERNRTRPPHSDYVNSWGSGAVEIAPGEWFPMVEPLADATTVDEIDRYPWPDMDDPTRIAHMADQAARLAAEGEYAIMAAPVAPVPARAGVRDAGDGSLPHERRARSGVRRSPPAPHRRPCASASWATVLDAVGDTIDIVKIGDDLGTQQSLLMSPAMYRSMLKPIHADLIASIRRRTKAKVFFHTDGDVFPLLDDLVEIGVDILNPIQTSAGQMADLATLKRRYGDALVFCGGIDTQRVLPHGTPDEVTAEVRRVMGELGNGGGYLLASVHTIMNDVPAANILAMVDAVETYGRYPAAIR